MPTYVYECKTCHQTFEADQSIKDDPLDTCICGAVGTIKRVIQPVAISFKGSGFHINDYSPKSSEASPKSPENAQPAGVSSANTPASTPEKVSSSTPDSSPASTPASTPKPSAPESS